MVGGHIQALGPKEDVLRKVLTTVPESAAPAAGGNTAAVSQLRRTRPDAESREEKM